ncbi:hypothetical protein [Flavobacterium sp.]|uniref:hypothetical protein n=1 Tax=Flavobacterium sp. TaxID=239 RepID=UPI0026052DA1|nr:hypothetical protein [Flavobacterium sp.]
MQTHSSTSTHKQRVVLVDSIPAFIKSIGDELSNYSNELKYLGHAIEIEGFQKKFTNKEVEIVILNESVAPTQKPITLISKIWKVHPKAKIILITESQNMYLVRNAFSCGVSAVLPYRFDFSDLIDAIRAISEGRIYLGSYVEQDLGKLFAHEFKEPKELFSELDFKIFIQLALGVSNLQIAGLLGKQPSYISLRRKNIESLLNVTTTTELLQIAIQNTYIRSVDGKFVVLS